MVKIVIFILLLSKYAFAKNNQKCDCLNGGRCQTTNLNLNLNQTANFSCECPSGNRFSGTHCEIDKCFKTKCNGTCWMDDSCKCHCGLDCFTKYCNNFGPCVRNSENELVCDCVQGFIGTRCEIRLPKQHQYPPELMNILLIWQIILLLVILIFILFFVFFCCQRKKDSIRGHIISYQAHRNTEETICEAEKFIS